uniref:ASD2 domain-containing protein n=1 Tax=Panagrellus redivivus TaxID=6233 RepID=A0A7E4W4I1_PANRE
MEYDTDTLASANRNRAASRKFFQQVNQQQTSHTLVLSQINLPLSTTMLHRTPSGAMRKIRQRREEMSQMRQSQEHLDATSPQSTATTTQSLIGYRSLVDSTAYHSILDDGMSFRSDISNSEDSFSSLKSSISINTFSKPEPPRRTLATIEHSNILNGSEKNYYDVNGTVNPPAKPTVEVHPMPPARTTAPLPIAVKQLVPPPIPKKPERLRKMIDQQITVNCQKSNSVTSVSPNENELPGERNLNLDTDTSSESVPIVVKKKAAPTSDSACCSMASSSVEALDRLHTSSLVRSIEEQFAGARTSVVELNTADLNELEKRRLIAIKKLTDKVADRKKDLDGIKNEKEVAIGAIRHLLGDHPLFKLIEVEIRKRADLIQIEGMARVRLQQIDDLNKEHAKALSSRRAYWNEKINDVRYLSVFVSERILAIEAKIYKLLSPENYQTYRQYMDLLIQLEAEDTETSEKLSIVQKQIDQLHSISPLKITG